MLMGTARITDREIERLLSRIGLSLRIRQFNTLASQQNIQRFVGAIGDDNPCWIDPTYARGTRYGCIIAPPMFLYSVLIPSGALAGGLPGVHSFLGGNDWQFFAPIRVNSRISASAKLEDVTKKQSEYGGQSVVVTVNVSYKDQHDRLLAAAKGWSIRVEREAGRQRGKYSGLPGIHKYTPEEIIAIEEACLSEEPRGATIRYWDETNVGDELAPVVKGPLTFEDMEHFLASTGGILSYAYRVQQLRRHPAFFYRDPNTNAWEAVSAVNLYDYAAQAVGIPRFYDHGAQRISWLGHLLTNWIGDNGFLERLYVKLLLPNIRGDTQWCKGKVARKYTQGDRFLVDCDIWCENQRGERTATGTATTRLLSRKFP
jgi:acyl dehydratase